MIKIHILFIYKMIYITAHIALIAKCFCNEKDFEIEITENRNSKCQMLLLLLICIFVTVELLVCRSYRGTPSF